MLMIHKTNYKIKVLIGIVLVYCTLFSYQITLASSINSQKLGELLNRERKSRGLSELIWESRLEEAAVKKGEHMIANNYFEHYAPDGTTPWYFINETGYRYKLAGENLAMDFTTCEAVHDAWMASITHRDNMLNPKYEDYAIAITNGKINGENTAIIVEYFATKNANYFVARANTVINLVLNYILGQDVK